MGDIAEAEAGLEQRSHIGLRINVLARLLRARFDRKVASLGVTRSQWQMIVVVARKPGVTQKAIADALEISEASAGRLIDRLCAEGMLERRERDDDRRARAVYITPRSEPLLARLAEIAREGENAVFAGFSSDELDRLENYLDRLYDNVTNAQN
ncbi:MAG TPA: MarR family transcriptional regulator [Novosphingobium sp.]|nr:MarR family transcriptional regulator [Novosphingobium sp.]HMP55664.1 MarR family transcriptional regulator [Novosphingobium sp.]